MPRCRDDNRRADEDEDAIPLVLSRYDVNGAFPA